MSWNPQPAATATPPSQSRSRAAVKYPVIAAVLLLPALVLAKIGVLATYTGSRCLMYGGCAPFPVVPFGMLLGAALVFMIAAIAAPELVRKPALAVQVLLEVVATGLVLAYP